jgi:hypothetical protein
MSETIHILTQRQLEVIHILADEDILIRTPTLSAPQRWHVGTHLIAAQTIEKLTQKGLVCRTDDEFHALSLTTLGKAVAKGKALQTKGRQWKIRTKLGTDINVRSAEAALPESRLTASTC